MAEKLDGSAIVANTIPSNRIQASSITQTQLQPALYTTIVQATHPKIRSLTYPGNDTAANTGGGDTIVVNGTGFGNTGNVQIYINGNAVSSITVTNANSVSFTAPALSAATYPLYLINTSDGSTAILIPGIQYSGTPTWTTTTPLTTQQADTAWNIQLVATSDSAVSYSLQAGSSLPAGITLAANGLISGTMSSPPVDETTYNFTVVANDLEQQDASRAFSVSVTVAALDPFFTYTTLLLHGDGTNNANNHAFVDSSTNNFAITKNGNATQGTFSPFGDNWSNYFDGSGDYLSIADNAALDLGTGDFTIEGWVYFSAAGSDNDGLISKRDDPTFTNGAWRVAWDATNKKINIACADENTARSTPAVSLHSWVHFAFVRSGSTLNCYANGVLGDQDASWGHNLNNAYTLLIGANVGGSNFLTGYLSNIRILKGTALYTAAFTPPTQPLTPVSNTSLLTCQSNAFVDKGPNRFAITRNGDTRVSKFDPFKPYKAIPASYGVYFDGTGDYLYLGGQSNFAFGTGDFTIEMWVYFNALPAGGAFTTFYDSRPTNTQGSYPTIYVDGSTSTLRYYHDSTSRITSSTISASRWYHLVVSRVSSNTRMFLDGTQTGSTYADTTNYLNGSSRPSIGSNGFTLNDSLINGYISNLRVVKGSGVTSVTVPTSPLTAVANTQLLTCQSTTIIDNSTNAFTITINGNAGPTDLNPFTTTFVSEKYNTANVGGSGYFDGSGDWLSFGAQSAFNCGTSTDFCMEAWVYRIGSNMHIWSAHQAAVADGFYFTTAGFNVYSGGGGGAGVTSLSKTVPAYAWSHCVLTRQNDRLRYFLNGELIGTSTSSVQVNTDGRAVGINGGVNFTGDAGYIAGSRFIKGAVPIAYNTAVTTTNTQIFIPPSAPVTTTSQNANSSQVIALVNYTNAGIIDSVGKNVLETVGDARVNTSVKKYGTGSMYFDGTGDYLRSPYNPDLQMKAADFTFECWVYMPSAPADYGLLFNTRNTNSQYSPFQVYIRSTRVVEVYLSTNGSTFAATITTTMTVPLTTWTHIAVVRLNGVVKIYINGVADGASATVASSLYEDTSWGNNIGAETTTTGIGNAFTGNIDDLRITRGVARYRYNFTPPTKTFNDGDGNLATPTSDVLVGDQVNTPVFPYTTLLLHGDGTNNANNHAFLDSSTNNFAITRNGNATQGTFSPFSPTGWSNFFDGNGDYLSFTGSSALTASADFTFECWIFVRSIVLTGSSNPRIIEMPNGLTLVLVTSTNNLRVDNESNGSSPISTGNGSIQLNQWMHLAVVRSGSTLTAYLNGVNAGSATHSTTFTGTGTVTIGYSAKYGSVAYFDGYISNLRYIVGNALYTANFTPPTSALTAVANTQLLTCQNNRFIDNSNNAFALTRGGDASVQAFSPFPPSVEYTANTHGGSAYFDGTGDYLSLASNTAFAYPGDFTIECWVYLNATGQQHIYEGRIGTTTNTLLFFINASTQPSVYINGSVVITSSTALTTGQWYHLATSRVSNTLYLFVNGVSVATPVSSSVSIASGNGLYIGINDAASGSIFNGYISSLRVLKGTGYTSMSVPTAPLTAISNTQLLLSATNAGILDSTGKNVLETVGDAKVNTAIKKYGTGSMYFDGSGDYIVGPYNPMYDLGAADFTIEFWIYPTAVGQSSVSYIFYIGSSGNYAPILIGQAVGNYGIVLYSSSSGSAWNLASASSFGTATQNAWNHVALSRYGSNAYLFLNGILGTTLSWSTTALLSGSSNRPNIGSATGVSNTFYTGYIDDFRVTRGIARYVTNFTPPTAAFLNK